MRVGQAFSKALDPSKAPLFSDLGGLELLPEEAWHRDCLASNPGSYSGGRSAAAALDRGAARCASAFAFHLRFIHLGFRVCACRLCNPWQAAL
jgi:hypothetical protein